MHSLSALLAAALLCAGIVPMQVPSTQRQLLLSASDKQRVIGQVQGWRAAVNPPAVRFDWCAIPTMFDVNGDLQAAASDKQLAIAVSTKQCAERSPFRRPAGSNEVFVRVEQLDLFPDSVVVVSLAMRAGSRVLEEYVLTRRAQTGELGVALSRQRSILYSH
jgi:hypothetical protein